MSSLPPAKQPLEITCSRHFPAWLAERRLSLAITTYQANKLFLVGLKPAGRLSVFERTFPRCMGVWTDGQAIWLASQFQLWRFENMLAGRDGRWFRPVVRPSLYYTSFPVIRSGPRNTVRVNAVETLAG